MWVALEIDDGSDRTMRVVGPFDTAEQAQDYAKRPPSDPDLWSWMTLEVEMPKDAA